MKFAALALLLALGLALAAQSGPTSEDQEPHHRIRLQNRYVRVVEFEIPAGSSTEFFSRSHETIGVTVSRTTLRSRDLGRIAVEQRPSPAGDLFGGDFTRQPQQFRLWNVGEQPYRAILLELLHALPASIPEPNGPGDPDFETPHLAAYRYVLPEGTSSPTHTHTRPYLIVAATPMKLRMTAPNGQSRSEDVLPGDFHWIEAKVTHALYNDGQQQAQIVEIELK